jgi:hypothetical protein
MPVKTVPLCEDADRSEDEEAVRRLAKLLVAFGALLAVLVLFRPGNTWDGRPFGPRGWMGMPWGPPPGVFFPAPLPYGSRFYYPPGVPLTYYEPGSGTTYCLSRPTGVYYICGYSPDTRESAEAAYRILPAGIPSLGEQGLPAPSGVLIFRLQQNAEAAVDGVPVGLSQGLGITSVIPGRHRIVVRVSGAEIEHAVTVTPHAIFTVTPTAIVPTAP